MTRADRIRSMDDVELADYLCESQEYDCGKCPYWDNGIKKCQVMPYLQEEDPE